MTAPDIGTVFDAGSAEFRAWLPLLWDPIGERTVMAAAPRDGDRVLDACCGAGSSALPAARAVGLTGWVDAVDLSDGLLAIGRQRAAGLPQLRFTRADVDTWQPAGGVPYSLVQCVFGVFFLPDMEGGTARLASLLAPGGRMAVTTWQRGSAEPLIMPLVDAVGRVRDAEQSAPTPRAASSRVDTVAGLTQLLADAGLRTIAVRTSTLDIPLTPELAWSFVTGAATRALLAGLDDEQRRRVRDDYQSQIQREAVTTFRVAVLIGTGIAPDQGPRTG